MTRRGVLAKGGARGATPEQLEAVYRDGFTRFLRVATAMTRDQELGRDAVQSAFVAALRARKSFRGTGTLEAWVWQVVVNEARRIARSSSELLLADPPETRGTSNGDHPDPAGVRRWVAALPPRQREAVFLRYFADLDYKTIARVLDLEPGTVSATLSSAHQTLRKRLEGSTR